MTDRRLYQNRISGVACLIFAGTLWLLALVLMLEESWPPTVVLPQAAIGSFFFGYRLGRGGILADCDGIRIRNPFSTSHRIAWDEIDSCSLEEWAHVMTLVVVTLRDGQRLPVFMLEASPSARLQDNMQALVRDLNRRVMSGSSRDR